jgi:hypothetical protein
MAKDKCRPRGGGKSKVREKRTESSDRRSEVALSATSDQCRRNSHFASQEKAEPKRQAVAVQKIV